MIEFFIQNSYLVSQICGFVSTICMIISYFQHQKEKFFTFQTIGNVFVVLSYFALSRYVPSIGCIVATVRTFIFGIFEKKGRPIPWLLVIAIISVNIFASVLTFQHWLDIIFVIGLVLFTLSAKIKSTRKMHFMLLIPLVLYSVYAGVFRNYTTMASTIFEFISLVVSIITETVLRHVKIDKKRKHEHTDEQAEVIEATNTIEKTE